MNVITLGRSFLKIKNYCSLSKIELFQIASFTTSTKVPPSSYSPSGFIEIKENIFVKTIDYTYIGIEYGLRTTAIKIKKHNQFLLHAPVPLDPSDIKFLKEHLDKNEEKNKENTEKNKDDIVKYLVFPNKPSSNFIREVKNQFKNGQVFSYPVDKRKSGNDTIELNDNVPPNTWEDELEQYLLKGMPPQLNEVVFFHKKSKTLILNELLLYFQNVDNKPFFFQNLCIDY